METGNLGRALRAQHKPAELGSGTILGLGVCGAESICRSGPWQIREEGEGLGPGVGGVGGVKG